MNSISRTEQQTISNLVSFQGTACASGNELLRSPVSGLPCLHWRLRIVEHVTSRMQLVHEVASPESFDLSWSRPAAAGERAPVRIRLDPEGARIEAAPVLHREGTPGAVAAGRHFGLQGLISVEEVMIRPGDELSAEGILEDPDAGVGQGPFRSSGHGLQLHDATVSLATRNLGPAVLLPWALGTAAALLGGVGAATYAAWRYHLINLPEAREQRVQGTRLNPPHPEMEAQKPPRPRMP
jgi:hypothetical protein